MGYRKITFLEELIMISLLHQPRYGLEIIEVVSEASEGEFDLNLGTLFTALGRLAKKNLIEKRVLPKSHRSTPSGSRKYYQITEEGRALLSRIETVRQALVLSR